MKYYVGDHGDTTVYLDKFIIGNKDETLDEEF